MKGREIYIKHLNFGSFIKWNLYISGSLGIIMGLLFTIISLLGGNINSEFNGKEITGVQEILFTLIFTPIFILFFGLITSLFLFLPLWLILKITKGIRLKGVFELEVNEITAQNTTEEQ